MCSHLVKLGCEEGSPVYNSDKPGPPDVPNYSCKDFCVEMETNGVLVNPKCVATVPECSLVEEYRHKDPETCVPK